MRWARFGPALGPARAENRFHGRLPGNLPARYPRKKSRGEKKFTREGRKGGGGRPAAATSLPTPPPSRLPLAPRSFPGLYSTFFATVVFARFRHLANTNVTESGFPGSDDRYARLAGGIRADADVTRVEANGVIRCTLSCV